MKGKKEYEEMIFTPNECNISVKPVKKKIIRRKKENPIEDIKEKVLNKINGTEETVTPNDSMPTTPENNQEVDIPVIQNENGEEVKGEEKSPSISPDIQSVKIKRIKKKKDGTFKIIAVQIAVIGALIVTIALTDALVPSSGINTFIKSVFGGKEAEITDERVFSDFDISLPFNESNITLNEGVMSISGKSSVYSPCDGTVNTVTKREDGKIDVEILHNKNFKTVFSGIDYLYFNEGEKVFNNIPLGYVKNGASACFYQGDGAVIVNFTITDGALVWAV